MIQSPKFQHSYTTTECGRFTHHIGKTSRHNGDYVGMSPEGSHRRVEVHAKTPLVRVNPTFKYLEFPMWSPLWWLDLPMWYPKLHCGARDSESPNVVIELPVPVKLPVPIYGWLTTVSCRSVWIPQCGGKSSYRGAGLSESPIAVDGVDATTLGTSTSTLRLWRNHPPHWEILNSLRHISSLRRYREI